MLVNCRYESLPAIVVKLAPYGEHQEPLTESNGVCMAPQLWIIIAKTKSKDVKLKELKHKVYNHVQQNHKII